MCDTLVGKNHRLANWNYARGCKCQYKEIVDWCGCSPNVFWVDDKPKLLQSVSTGGVFARKFDGKICNSMIEFVETELVHAAPFTAKGFYWESVFEVDDGGGSQAGPVTYFASFARLGVNHLMETCTNGSGLDQESTTLLESHLVMKDDSFLGYAVKISVASGAGTIVFEVLVTTDDEFLFSQTPRNGGGSSVMGPLGVGVGYDGKERVFNRRGGMLTSADSPMIAGLWPTQSPLTMSFEWRGPDAASTVQSTQTHGVGREKLLLMHQLNKRLAPGTWVATIKPGQQPEYKRPPKSEFTLRFPVAEVHPVGTTRLATPNAYLNGGVVQALDSLSVSYPLTTTTTKTFAARTTTAPGERQAYCIVLEDRGSVHDHHRLNAVQADARPTNLTHVPGHAVE
jgi:protein xylosyltransferase